MRPRQILLMAGAIFCISLSVNASDGVDEFTRTNTATPMAFTKNMGQWPDSILFRADAGDAIMWFVRDGIYYQFTKHIPQPDSTNESNPQDVPFPPRRLDVEYRQRDSIQTALIKVEVVGANPNAVFEVGEELDYKCNYFLGNDPAKWHTDVPNYSAITIKGLIPGLDIIFKDDQGKMICEQREERESLSHQLQLRYSGAIAITAKENGTTVVQTTVGERTFAGISLVSEPTPILSSGSINAGTSSGVTLAYSTYLGGTSGGMFSESGEDIAVDNQGCAYVTGLTQSIDFPLQNPIQSDPGDEDVSDVFVTKLSADGGSLVYSTYIGGISEDYGDGIAVDHSGSAYVTGYTSSADFPIQNAYQPEIGNDRDAFVFKISPSGNAIIYSTFLGGYLDDWATDISTDPAGHVYVTGFTMSNNFPATALIPPVWLGNHAFVAKFSTDGASLVYSTRLGDGLPMGIAIDSTGCAYIAGSTYSSSFPTLNPFQTDPGDGMYDGFVCKLVNDGSGLVYSTYLGGSSDDMPKGIDVDDQGCAYVAGNSFGTDFPTVQPFQTQGAGFLSKFSPSGDELVYSTRLCAQTIMGVAVDRLKNAYVTGESGVGFPLKDGYQSASYNYDYGHAFVTKFAVNGDGLVYSTLLGGNAQDWSNAIVVDTAGNAYFTGRTESNDFPTTNPVQVDRLGYVDAFVSKFESFGGRLSSQLVTDNFDIGIPSHKWHAQFDGCQWIIEEDGWVDNSWRASAVGQQIYCSQVVGDSSWRNFEFSAQVRGNAGVDKVLIFRIQDENHWYGVNLKSSTGELLLVKRENSGLPRLLASWPYSNGNGSWYDIKVTCVDEQISAYVNGNYILSFSDTSDVYYSGGVGLTCYTGGFGSCDVSFDNVEVSDPFPHFEFDTLVQGEIVGDVIQVSGRLLCADGQAYQPPNSLISVEDPVNSSTSSVNVRPDGSFVYSASSSGGSEGLHMYVFSCNTPYGVVRDMYAVALRDGSAHRLPTASQPVIWLSRKIKLLAKNARRALPKATDFMAFRTVNSAYRASGQVMGDGLKAMFGTMAGDIAAGWKRTYQSGDPLVEGSKLQLEKCELSKPWTLTSCFLGTAGLVWAGTDLPANTFSAKMQDAINKSFSAGIMSACTKGKLEDLLARGELAYGVWGLSKGKIGGVANALRSGLSFVTAEKQLQSTYTDCPGVGDSRGLWSGTFLMPPFDLVGAAFFPLYKKAIVIRGHSPIEIEVTDPLGRKVTSHSNEIPGAFYLDLDLNLEGESEQIVIVPLDSTIGDCMIQISAKPGADPSAPYSAYAMYTYYQDEIVLAQDQPVSSIPPLPVSVPTFENLPASLSSILIPSGHIFDGYPAHLVWSASIDPNPGHLVSYDIVLSSLPDLSDSLVITTGVDTTFDLHSLLFGKVALYDTAQYYWKVIAHDDWGAGSISTVDSFTVSYCCSGATGNVNGSVAETPDLSDLSLLISYLTVSPRPVLPCIPEANVNAADAIDLSDLSLLIGYLTTVPRPTLPNCP